MLFKKNNQTNDSLGLRARCECISRCSGIQCWNDPSFSDTNYAHTQTSLRYSGNSTVSPWSATDLTKGN